jgi:hypothetical protein
MNKPLPTVGDRVFLKTKSGYVDPASWRVDQIASTQVELVKGDYRKIMTFEQFKKIHQEELIVDFTPTKEGLKCQP